MNSQVDIIVIGGSLGAFDAIPELIRPLPLELPAAIIVVLHRTADPTSRLDHLLSDKCGRSVTEPSSGDAIALGSCYLAPSNYHLLIEPGAFALSTEGPVMYSRPSIDVALESAALSYEKRCAAVILTGATPDGAEGARVVTTQGGRVLIQDPTTAHSPAAPQAAVHAVPSAFVGSLAALTAELSVICGGRP